MAVSKKTVVPVFWDNHFEDFMVMLLTTLQCSVMFLPKKMCNVCCHFFFDMEPVFGSFFVSQHVIDLEGNGTMGNQFINLF